ncbi:unnamed protein product, partial [Ilex paraguariensis]
MTYFSFRWIANCHEHETLLQENEDEKLSKEEQDMAWEVYRKTLKWGAGQRIPAEETTMEQRPLQTIPASESAFGHKPTISVIPPPAPETSNLAHSIRSTRNRVVSRKCTNLSHLLTLRSQGTKTGCSTVCGECAQEISWEDLNRDSKSL